MALAQVPVLVAERDEVRVRGAEDDHAGALSFLLGAGRAAAEGAAVPVAVRGHR